MMMMVVVVVMEMTTVMMMVKGYGHVVLLLVEVVIEKVMMVVTGVMMRWWRHQYSFVPFAIFLVEDAVYCWSPSIGMSHSPPPAVSRSCLLSISLGLSLAKVKATLLGCTWSLVVLPQAHL